MPVAEEAVVAAVVPAVRRAAGLDQLGDVAVAVGQTPAGQQGDESQEGRLGEGASEIL